MTLPVGAVFRQGDFFSKTRFSSHKNEGTSWLTMGTCAFVKRGAAVALSCRAITYTSAPGTLLSLGPFVILFVYYLPLQ